MLIQGENNFVRLVNEKNSEKLKFEFRKFVKSFCGVLKMKFMNFFHTFKVVSILDTFSNRGCSVVEKVFIEIRLLSISFGLKICHKLS